MYFYLSSSIHNFWCIHLRANDYFNENTDMQYNNWPLKAGFDSHLSKSKNKPKWKWLCIDFNSFSCMTFVKPFMSGKLLARNVEAVKA